MPVHQQRLPPHLIVLLVDDLGWHNVGFRNPQQHSPNLDELARSGAQLARHYTYRWCSPSRSAFLSGRLPIHVNEANAPNITSPGGIDVRMTLLPQKLKQGGYQTAAYGKWHVGARFRENLPSHRGFDEFFGFLAGSQDHYSNVGTWEAAGALDLWSHSAGSHDGPAYGRSGAGYSCEVYGAAAVDRIQRHDTSRPLFLYLAFQGTHAPFQCPERYEDPSVAHRGRRAFQGMLTCIDGVTGNVTRALRRRGMWANTFLLWSSDNGGDTTRPTEGANNHPLRGGKGTDFEGGVRAVAVVAGGGLRLRPGSVVHAPIHIADWYATFGAMAGIAEPLTDASAAQHGLPAVDSIDQSTALGVATAGQPLDGRAQRDAGAHGARADEWPRREIPISSNALIDGDMKLVISSAYVRTPDGNTRRGLGFWTGPVWPNYAQKSASLLAADPKHHFEPDPGCPAGVGCLFNLSSDPNERYELSSRMPGQAERLRARLRKLLKHRYQTGWDEVLEARASCTSLAEYVRAHRGFAGPVCAVSFPSQHLQP